MWVCWPPAAPSPDSLPLRTSQYEKYNAVLRAESGNAFMTQRCHQLTLGNRYATSIHAVTSCVLKLAKVTAACKVYRGLADAALPDAFFTPNEHGVCGGVEFGFTSTSKHKAAAVDYSLGGGAPTVFEMQTVRKSPAISLKISHAFLIFHMLPQSPTSFLSLAHASTRSRKLRHTPSISPDEGSA